MKMIQYITTITNGVSVINYEEFCIAQKQYLSSLANSNINWYDIIEQLQSSETRYYNSLVCKTLLLYKYKEPLFEIQKNSIAHDASWIYNLNNDLIKSTMIMPDNIKTLVNLLIKI